MRSRNVICGVKFDWFWTFDRRRPSWILRKMKNSSTGLFLGSSCMSMQNLVQIRWIRSKLLQKHSFCWVLSLSFSFPFFFFFFSFLWPTISGLIGRLGINVSTFIPLFGTNLTFWQRNQVNLSQSQALTPSRDRSNPRDRSNHVATCSSCKQKENSRVFNGESQKYLTI